MTVLGLPIVPETTAFGALWLDPNTAVGVASAGERVVPAAALLSLSGLDLTAQSLVLRGRLLEQACGHGGLQLGEKRQALAAVLLARGAEHQLALVDRQVLRMPPPPVAGWAR